jgi:hypothetical protein
MRAASEADVPETNPQVSPVGATTTAAELNERPDLFRDAERPDEDNAGPFLVVVDNFYPDPHEVRKLALSQAFAQYMPPLARHVGNEIADRYKAVEGTWHSSVLEVFMGKPVEHPVLGVRHNPPSVRERLAAAIGEEIQLDTWDSLGDGWNGAFHLMDARWKCGAIHHHYKEGDVCPRGWSGVVYLSPDAPPSAGTTIWRGRRSGVCVASKGSRFYASTSSFVLVMAAENRFNRLVLFRENVLHRAEHGFGEGNDARLTQTFFFRTQRKDDRERSLGGGG